MASDPPKPQTRKGATTVKRTESDQPFWRQGDIFFVKVVREPEFEATKPIETGIIARGEQTGHMHRVSPSSLADGATLVVRGDSMYLRAPESVATIIHDEHGPI